jgi:hypothetical protein
MGAAIPTLVGVGMFTAVRQVDRMFEPAEAFEDLEAPKAVPHKHEIKVIPSERSNGGD